MKKLHVKIRGQWLPVFCRNDREVVTCENNPAKALPMRACWATDDLAYFKRHFAHLEFTLCAAIEKGVTE